MIYFLSSPASSRKLALEQLNIKNLLMSFGVDGNHWQKFLNYNVLIDSGAFSIFNSGKKLDIDDYLNFIKKLPRKWNYISFDVIPRNKFSKKETDMTAEKTFENYLYLSKNCDNIVPVIHYGEDIKHFKRYLDYTDYICCGRLLGNYKKSYENYKEIFKISRDKIKIHGLAASDIRLLYDFPFYSIDSITYKKTVNKQLGTYWTGGKLKVLLYENLRKWMNIEKQITNLWEERGITWVMKK